MELWSFYFLGKLYLYVRGYIHFHPILNVLFAIFLIIPVSKNLPFYRLLKTVKIFLSVVFAFSLLWYDSWLPPLFYSIQQLEQQGMPSKEYIVHFLLGFIKPFEITVLLFLLVLCIFMRNRVRLTPIVFIFILIVPLLGFGHNKADKGDIESYIEAFYQSESKRVIHFETSNTASPDFDIIILHICSLAWDDLKVVGLEKHPFFKQFDIFFTNFNSATSYSDPSAIRLFRASCGQQRHDALYRDAPKECYLMENLCEQGYVTYSAVDYYDSKLFFVKLIMNFGLADPPIATEDIPSYQYSYEEYPIFDTLAILGKWWDMRQNSKSKRSALYFDITNLHGGSHLATEKNWWIRDEAIQYKKNVQSLFRDLEKFFNKIVASKQNFVVVFIPEHGLALRGSSIQPKDLRDIPLPQITLVPVGIKLIGEGRPPLPVRQEIISKPTSYLAISYLLGSFLKEPPFGTSRLSTQNILSDIPETSFVSENEKAEVVKKGEDYFLYGKDKQWNKLSSSVLK